jgi:glycerol-3-phosphate cytidylyltransferase-like family protein
MNNTKLVTNIVCTSGGFELLHVGHLRCIQETVQIAKEKGAYAVVIVNGDGFLKRKHGFASVSELERAEIVSGISGVDYVVIWDDGTQTVSDCLNQMCPLIFTKGGDRTDPSKIPEYQVCQDIGCDVVFGVGGDKIQSSTNIKNEIRNKEFADDEFRKSLRRELTTLEELLVSKNKKYGNSALEPIRTFSKLDSVEQIKIRIDDKLSRIKNAGMSGPDEDTVQDLMGYLILLRIAGKLTANNI